MIYILHTDKTRDLAKLTEFDISRQLRADFPRSLILLDENPRSSLRTLSEIEFAPGDLICFAGLILGPNIQTLIDYAVEKQINTTAGKLVDHRCLPIETGKISKYKSIEVNNYNAYPYYIIVGNPEQLKLSFEITLEFTLDQLAFNYLPEQESLLFLLACATTLGDCWQKDFELVDMSVRDLEIARVMYASNMWHDWISFYPTSPGFKLENHTILPPLWLEESRKPLEYII